MPAYVIAMMTVNDPDTYRKYTDRTPATVERHGGRFLTRGEDVTTMEGKQYDGRMVILEFPAKANVEAWYADPDYEEAMTFRHASAELHMLLAQEGGSETASPDPKV